MSVAGSVALVTGAGRGIGRAIAVRFAAAGVRVAVAARTGSDVDAVARDIATAGGESLAVPCDVTVAGDVARAYGAVEERFGAVDILVNNAGFAESAPLLDVSEDLWARTLAVNLTGTFLCSRAALRGMLDRGHGRIVNVASVAARVGFPYSTAYCAAKHGVLGFTRALALEVAARGITVNAICPGWVDTEMTEASIARIVRRTGRTPAAARRALEEMSPQRRLMRPDEIAEVALFLAGDAAAGITGQAIGVDGGEVMA